VAKRADPGAAMRGGAVVRAACSRQWWWRYTRRQIQAQLGLGTGFFILLTVAGIKLISVNR